jgi:hypothetical protein
VKLDIVWRAVKRWARRAGIENLTPHDLRAVAPASAMAQEASSNSFSFSLVTRRCERPNDTSGASKSLKQLSMIDFESHSQTMRLKSGHCSADAVSAYEQHKSEMPTDPATRITHP